MRCTVPSILPLPCLPGALTDDPGDAAVSSVTNPACGARMVVLQPSIAHSMDQLMAGWAAGQDVTHPDSHVLHPFPSNHHSSRPGDGGRRHPLPLVPSPGALVPPRAPRSMWWCAWMPRRTCAHPSSSAPWCQQASIWYGARDPFPEARASCARMTPTLPHPDILLRCRPQHPAPELQAHRVPQRLWRTSQQAGWQQRCPHHGTMLKPPRFECRIRRCAQHQGITTRRRQAERQLCGKHEALGAITRPHV